MVLTALFGNFVNIFNLVFLSQEKFNNDINYWLKFETLVYENS